jgi:hypothetical protein
MTEPWTEADDVVEEVREIRRRISAEFDDDPDKIVQHYMEYQKQFADRLVDYDKADRKGKSAA